MKTYKRLKDPIYGYVNVPVEYMEDIVDTACFQRLRRVIQTSYSPLYSSAVHNRFVHSVGVYHLGEIASFQLEAEINQKFPQLKLKIEPYIKVFLLACLLHDVGHAPFSHTGEIFYLDEKSEYSVLHKDLARYVKNSKFKTEIPLQKSVAAAPHELMSAILGLKEFGDFFKNSEERAFFARCITGYRYLENTEINMIRNCFISLLNSKVIDVDKLDYLIRDAYATGFDTVKIDYERLLTALTVMEHNGVYELAYHKSAISVIENVIYAHDSERKWIQSHPIILYEGYILQHVIAYLCREMDRNGKKLMALEALSREGECFEENIKVRLLCDDDIIYLMKNIYSNEIGKEFFERRSRRHPLWKSEAEYKAFFLGEIGGGRAFDAFEAAMDDTARYLEKNTDSWVVDNTLINTMEAEIEKLGTTKLDETTRQVQLKAKTSTLKIMKCLKKIAEDNEIECNFVILRASQFNSGFGKPDFSKINIVFSSRGAELSNNIDVVSSLKAKGSEREKFFYLFYKRKEGKKEELDNLKICKTLLREFV